MTVAGRLTGNPAVTDFYSFAVNVGDHLQFTLVADPQPAPIELLLYDAHGNLVAIANGNASDGVSSIIDFTIPGGDGGTWTVQASSSPSFSPFATDYTLTIKGSTATGPVVP